jgi:hypothetical protein
MSRRLAVPALMIMVMLTGCDPQLNLAGAYIPGWLVCIGGGIFCFWITHVLLLKIGLIPFIKPLAMVYAALIAFYSCLLWLLFFAS